MTLSPDAARLDGMVAVVTGGGAGIGRGIAEGLHAFGAQVAIWERDGETAAAAAAAVDGLGLTVDVRTTRRWMTRWRRLSNASDGSTSW